MPNDVKCAPNHYFFDGILAMENYKNIHYLVHLYMKFPCCYVFIFVKHF